jgi:acyl-CoA thioester hydrolase
MRVVFRPEAEDDLLSTREWYDSRREGLGKRHPVAFPVCHLLPSAIRNYRRSCDTRTAAPSSLAVADVTGHNGDESTKRMIWHELTRGVVMPPHCDVYGHMNVRHYASFFDDAGWHMLAKAGVSLSELQSQGLGSVVATLTIDFHHELKAGQLIVVSGAFTRVGAKSFHYEMRLHESESMIHCATQKTVEVCFDTRARASAPLPDHVRARIQQAIEA